MHFIIPFKVYFALALTVATANAFQKALTVVNI